MQSSAQDQSDDGSQRTQDNIFDMVRYQLYRNIRRVLSDAFGQDVEIAYVTYDDWRERSQ